MTKKIFHDDPYQKKFEAKIIEKNIEGKKAALVLNQTCFYPDSGGQLCDKGMIGGASVIDVRENNGNIVHYLEDNIKAYRGDSIVGEIDWEIRFDHMQQHSGQHILSGILMSLWQKETLSFHMGEEICTLDIPWMQFDEKKTECLEKVANHTIYDNRPIYQYYLEKDNYKTAEKLRKKQELYENLRIVEIDKFDLTACGGTHCRNTGEIGMIKITGWENRKDKIRIFFLCGNRALRDYQNKHLIIKRIADFLTTGNNQLEEKVIKLSQEQNKLNKTLKKMEKKLMLMEAGELKEKYGKKIKDYFLISKLFGENSIQFLQKIASILVNCEKHFIVLAVKKPIPVLCLACSKDCSIHMGELIQKIVREYNGKGGGSNHISIGKLKKSEDVPSAFDCAIKLITSQLK